MNWFLLGIFVTVAAAMIAPAIWRKDYRLQFPCLAGLTVLFQVALPMAALNLQPDAVSASLARFSVMASLCLLAAWAGYAWWPRSQHPALIQFDPKRLATSAIVLFAFGSYFVYRCSETTADIDPDTGNWTGIMTIYSTLSEVARYGAILAVILYLRTKNWKLLLLVLPQLWMYFQLFMIGRRGPTGEIAVIVCMLLWFYRKWAIPTWLMLLGVFGMAVFCVNVGTIRATVGQPLGERLKAIVATDPMHTITPGAMAENENYLDVFNGVHLMEATASDSHYNYGLNFWNKLVFGYVPAQFVGRNFKNSLMVSWVDDTRSGGFEKSVGTCDTGIGEAFMAFGYLGCMYFFVLGAFMRWLWEGASRNCIWHQFLLMLCTMEALVTFSVQIWTLLNMLVNIAIFVGPLLWWSHVQSVQPATDGRRKRKKGNVQSEQKVAPHSVTAQAAARQGAERKAQGVEL